jgi:hypothetical protein
MQKQTRAASPVVLDEELSELLRYLKTKRPISLTQLRSDLNTITDKARVPEKNRRHFLVWGICHQLRVAWEGRKFPFDKSDGFARAVKAAIALHEALAELTDAQLQRIESIFSDSPDRFFVDSKAVGWREVIYHMVTAIMVACGDRRALASLDARRPKRRGRRPKTGMYPDFGYFVFSLVADVYGCGGRLSFQKSIPKGTLVEIIEILSSYLPPRFVPDSLPGSTMQGWWEQGRKHGRALPKK